MGINANSKHPDQAWQFMTYMLGQKGQTLMATGAGLSPVRPDVLNDPAVQAKSPQFKLLSDILQHTKSRPQLKNYTAVSAAVQPNLSAIMTKQSSLANGLKAAQAAVDAIQNA
ncbi:MAG: extracellular solute-binding protein [Chloroflexota bacterium]